MKDDISGAYLISRHNRPRREKQYKNRGPRRAAGFLIAVLLLLTAGICLLVVFLPNLTKSTGSSSAVNFGGKTYYFLATAESTDRTYALTAAQAAAERGGAGYIFNNGNYHIVAAVYEREADVKTLVSVNDNSHYLSLSIPAGVFQKGDKRVLDYLIGEWFQTVYTAATELDRGNITDSAAEHAVNGACKKLAELASGAETDALKNAVKSSCSFQIQGLRTVLSYVRYINASVIISVCEALA